MSLQSLFGLSGDIVEGRFRREIGTSADAACCSIASVQPTAHARRLSFALSIFCVLIGTKRENDVAQIIVQYIIWRHKLGVQHKAPMLGPPRRAVTDLSIVVTVE